MNEKDYEGMLDWLYNLRRFGMKLDLDRISIVMQKLENPQEKTKIIHIAGTNGKGSVCAMLSSIFQKAGYKVGMFTSPHLVDFRERFQINNEKISKEDVFRLVNGTKETGIELTFFEITAAIAFQYFYERGVDFVILEVGMGGQFDATNIVKKPVATIITSVSFDHTEWLGDTLDKIAYEKAGIVKEDTPLFKAVDSNTIRDVCKEKNAPFVLVDNREKTNMNGVFQKNNAGLAASVARYLEIEEDKIEEGLMSVKWPARLEFVEENVLLDCAHNADGILKMAEFVKNLKVRQENALNGMKAKEDGSSFSPYFDYNNLIIVFGVMNNKDYRKMIENLPAYDKIILTRPQISRSLNPEDLKDTCHDSIVIEDVAEAYSYANEKASKHDLILICGSCYLAGEFLAFKNKIPMHPIMFVQ